MTYLWKGILPVTCCVSNKWMESYLDGYPGDTWGTWSITLSGIRVYLLTSLSFPLPYWQLFHIESMDEDVVVYPNSTSKLHNLTWKATYLQDKLFTKHVDVFWNLAQLIGGSACYLLGSIVIITTLFEKDNLRRRMSSQLNLVYSSSDWATEVNCELLLYTSLSIKLQITIRAQIFFKLQLCNFL